MPTPTALQFTPDNCTIGRTMAILGDRQTFVVLREVFNGIRRFDDIRAHSGVPRQVLTNRLHLLVGHGILRREPYREPGARQRHEYRLTDKGFDLYPILVTIAAWGERHLDLPDGRPVEFAHRDCGELVEARLTCAAGHDVEDVRDVLPRPGPGARPVQARPLPG